MKYYKGDIFYVATGRTVGSEIKKERPAVIISNDLANDNSETVVVAYMTSQPRRPLPTHAEIMCKVPSTVLCEQIATVDKERLGMYIRTCTQEEMLNIDHCIQVEFGLKKQQETKKDTTEIEKERDLYKRMYQELLHFIAKRD